MSPPIATPQQEDRLEVHEIRDLAVRGVAALGLRTLVIRGMGLAASLVLARLLTPHDFGLMAFGLAILSLGAFITDGGLGAALLRLEHVERRQLEAIFGAQLLLASLAAVAIVAIAAPLGKAGAVAAIMALSLPLDCVRIPGALLTERRLNYSPIVRAEVAEMAVYNVVAVASVALGAGIWGVAVAMPCRAVAGTLVLVQQSGVLVRPRLLLGEVRGLYEFGVRVQGIALVSFVRDQGLNVATSAIGGLSVLGTMSFAQRLAQPLWLVFSSSWRVSFPAMSRLRDAGRDIAGGAVRTLRLVSAATGLAAVGVAGATPALVPSVFGDKWEPVIPVVPLVLLNLLIGGPMLACASGFFSTIGEPGRVLRAEVLGTAVVFCVSIPLLPVAGAIGLGVGALAGTITATAYMARALVQHGIRMAPTLATSALMSSVAAALGWFCAEALGPTLWSAVVAGIVATAAYAALLWTFERDAARDAIGLARHALPRRPAPART